MRKFFLIIGLFVVSFFFGQESVYSWKENFSISESAITGWNIDAFGNLIVSNSSALTKYNSTGEISYKISNKSFGEIKQIIPITPLKVVLFSEQQQQLCFVDNTLTQVNDCIDLGDYNIEFATFIGRSSRGEKLWVFDQVNSILFLIDLNTRGNIVQEIRNTKGLISLSDLVEIIEFQSSLFLFDSKGQLTTFDINGSLLSQVNIDCKDMSVSENQIWLVCEDELSLFLEGENPFAVCPLPSLRMDCFRVYSDQFFFQEDNRIRSFNLVKKK